MVAAPDFWSIRSCVVDVDIITKNIIEDNKQSYKDDIVSLDNGEKKFIA